MPRKQHTLPHPLSGHPVRFSTAEEAAQFTARWAGWAINTPDRDRTAVAHLRYTGPTDEDQTDIPNPARELHHRTGWIWDGHIWRTPNGSPMPI